MSPWKYAKESEHSHQVALFAWINIASLFGIEAAWDENSYLVAGHARSNYFDHERYPDLKNMFSIPNGGIRGDSEKSRKIRGGQLKAEGVKSGVSDIFLPSSRYQNRSINYNGLFIEMKNLKKSSKPSKQQLSFGHKMRLNGYAFEVCWGWEEAATVISSYIVGKYNPKYKIDLDKIK